MKNQEKKRKESEVAQNEKDVLKIKRQQNK